MLLGVDLEKISRSTIVILSFIMDISLALILYLIYKKDLKEEFIAFKSNWKEFITKNFKYWYIGLIIMSISNVIINFITSNDMANNEEIVRSIINKYPLYGVFSVVIMAPFVEEIVFRKTFKDVIKNKYILMAVCGVAFGLIHVVETYEKLSDLLYVIPYGIFGTVFAYMYYKTNTIFTSMSMHFFHNSLLLLLGFIISLLGW
jgi:membrane protease YdiL (CAAX protease family)